jgi:hypothetical protein
VAKYKEQVISGTEWVQLGKAKVFFFANKPTKIFFEEEQVKQISNETQVKSLREIDVTLSEPTTKFILVSPDDNQPTGGDMSYRQLERAIYSLYYAKAQELDAVVTP